MSSLPSHISRRRAAALLSSSRHAVDRMVSAGLLPLSAPGHSCLGLKDVEAIRGRAITPADYDTSTIQLERRRRAREFA